MSLDKKEIFGYMFNMGIGKPIKTQIVKVKLKELVGYEHNNRKISRQKLAELKRSLEELGNFGVIIIDEKNRILSGNQRVVALKDLYGDEYVTDAKQLIGYKEDYKKLINIRANVSSGEFTEGVAEELKEIEVNVDITLAGLDIDKYIKKESIEPEYEFSPEVLEQYNYVIFYFKNELDFMKVKAHYGLKNVIRKDITIGGYKGFNRVIDGKKLLEDL